MNREIKFRGLSISTKEWVYGYVYSGIPETYVTYIMPEFIYNGYETGQEASLRFENYKQVERKSIGQYTGLKDCEGKEIYEGDILETPKFIAPVIFEIGCFYANSKSGFYTTLAGFSTKSIRIIGNIFENPELLK